MLRSLQGLLRSRKAITALAGIVVTLVLLASGQIDADIATASISGMLAVLIGSIAYEDGKAKEGGSITALGSSVTVENKDAG